MKLLVHWIIYTVAIMITAYLLPGVVVDGFVAALVTALVLGIINMTLKPLLLLFTLPITILTLGIFALVVNALLILLASALVPGFLVYGFWWALLFSIVLSIINWALSRMVRA